MRNGTHRSPDMRVSSLFLRALETECGTRPHPFPRSPPNPANPRARPDGRPGSGQVEHLWTAGARVERPTDSLQSPAPASPGSLVNVHIQLLPLAVQAARFTPLRPVALIAHASSASHARLPQQETQIRINRSSRRDPPTQHKPRSTFVEQNRDHLG